MAAHRGANALADNARAVDRRIRQQRDELVAGVPRGNVARAKVAAQEVGDLDERVVALQMTIRVVDQLEVINVDDQQRNGLARGAGRLDGGAGRLDECASKREPCEIVSADR